MAVDREQMTVLVELSEPAARFLRGVVQHLNQAKHLPTDPDNRLMALECSAWLEEIEARLDAALNGKPDGEEPQQA